MSRGRGRPPIWDYELIALQIDAFLDDGKRVTLAQLCDELDLPKYAVNKAIHLHRNPDKGLSVATRALLCGTESSTYVYWISVDPDEIEVYAYGFVGDIRTRVTTCMAMIDRDLKIIGTRSAHGKMVRGMRTSLARSIEDMTTILDDLAA